MANIGTGTSITFATGFFAEILNVNWSGIERAAIDTTHMGTTTAMTYTPGTYFDPGELSVEMAFDGSLEPPWNDAAETVTVTFPDTGTTTWAASGFLTGFDVTAPLEDRQTATCTIKLSGDITVTNI